MPSPAPAVPPPSDEESVLSSDGHSASLDQTEELLSYFRRNHPGNSPANGSPASSLRSADALPRPPFLDEPASTPAAAAPALPPSTATYHVVP